MRFSDKKALCDILHQVMADDAGAKAVAADLDKPYSTLLGELNGLVSPDPRNKLGLVTTIELLEVTGRPEPFLDWLARRFDFGVFRAPPAEPCAESLPLLMTRAAKELGAVAAELLAALADGRIVSDELERIAREVRAAEATLQAVLEASRRATVTPLRERRRG